MLAPLIGNALRWLYARFPRLAPHPIVLPGLTAERAIPAATTAIVDPSERLTSRLGLDHDEEAALDEALVSAYVDGAHFAAVELVAQLIEAGVDVHLHHAEPVHD